MGPKGPTRPTPLLLLCPHISTHCLQPLRTASAPRVDIGLLGYRKPGDACQRMAATTVTSKRTLKGQALGPIGSERSRSRSRLHPRMDGQAHERQAGRRLPFPCSQRTVTSVTSTEPWSWRAFRQQQPEAGGGRLLKRCPGLGPRVSWATQPQADPSLLGGGAPGRGVPTQRTPTARRR